MVGVPEPIREPNKIIRVVSELIERTLLFVQSPILSISQYAWVRDFQIKKHPKFSCGMGILPVPDIGISCRPPHKMDNLFLGSPLSPKSNARDVAMQRLYIPKINTKNP
jgi:hypothetical protein